MQLVCGQLDVFNHYGSLIDPSRQQHQQEKHADKLVCSCHLQREVHRHVEESSFHLTSILNNTSIKELRLLFWGCDSVNFGRYFVEKFFFHVHFSLPILDVESLSPVSVNV